MNKQYKFIRYFLAPVVLLAIAGFSLLNLTSCENEEDYGIPVITGVRITDPAQADSLFDEGEFGQMVVLLGKNLSSTQEIYFNGEEAWFRSTLATNTSVICRIPSVFPKEITNQIRLVSLGGETTFNFTVEVPAPIVQSINNHMAPAGGDLEITGRYFANVDSVVLGDKLALISSITTEKIVVKVPEGLTPGPIKVYAVAGVGISSFNFQDPGYKIINFDDTGKCWGDMPVVDASTNPVPSPTAGNYARVTATGIGPSSWWNNEWVFASCGPFPEVTTGNTSDYVLRFEINCLEPWERGWYELKIAESGGEYFYRYTPYQIGADVVPFKTSGWITIDIPLSEFKAKVDGSPTGAVLPNAVGAGDLYFAFQNPDGGTVAKLDICFDNIRLIKIN